MKLKLVIEPEDYPAPVLLTTAIELAKKHGAHALIMFHEADAGPERPLTCMPSDLHFAVDEEEADYIECRWAHDGHTTRIYQA